MFTTIKAFLSNTTCCTIESIKKTLTQAVTSLRMHLEQIVFVLKRIEPQGEKGVF